MGGYGTKRTPQLAAQYADEFNLPFPPLDYYRPACDFVRAACDKAGREPESMRYTVALVAAVGTDEAEFARRAEAIKREPDDLRANGVGGTPAEAVERIRAFGDAGAETVYLQILDLDDHDHLRLIAAEVMEHV
jgi:alkanesulfonate monooxygenase SsuD/methylene tetrahydromethanopterin reductase-like flavin-dependent oxidoreductase (luciferase family)